MCEFIDTETALIKVACILPTTLSAAHTHNDTTMDDA